MCVVTVAGMQAECILYLNLILNNEINHILRNDKINNQQNIVGHDAQPQVGNAVLLLLQRVELLAIDVCLFYSIAYTSKFAPTNYSEWYDRRM